jgi:uncharacterized protein
MPPNAVIDASVLVSAFLFPDSTPGRVVALAEAGAYSLHLSPILLEEVRRSLYNPRLRRSYAYTDDAIEAWCARLSGEIGEMMTQPLPEIGPVCRDPDDDHVIAAALAVNADYIVTGDRDLLVLARHEHIRIISAREFLEALARD